MLATLSIEKIHAHALIGVYPEEREATQPVVWSFSYTLADGAYQAASQSDSLQDTVDYYALLKQLQGFIRGSSFQLLESFVGALADQILAFDTRIESVIVSATKTLAIAGTNGPTASVAKKRGDPASSSLCSPLPDSGGGA
jgi:dihydroneopterin aldolase